MSLRKLLLIAIIIFTGSTAEAQTENDIVKKPSIFAQQWEEYYTLGNDGLPFSQLVLLDSIMQAAIVAKNGPEFNKTLELYPSIVSESMMESAEKHEILKRFEAMTLELVAPFSNILHHFLSQQYSGESSAWDLDYWSEDFSIPVKIDGVTVFFNNKNITDQEIIKEYHYKKSLENLPLLYQQSSIEYANSYYQEEDYFKKNPTLADIFATDYIIFLSENLYENTFDPMWYDATEDFLKKSSIAPLAVYQQLEFLHLKANNLEAYTNTVLNRLQDVSMYPNQEDKTSDLYNAALVALRLRLNGHPSTLGVILIESQDKLRATKNRYSWENQTNVNLINSVYTELVVSLQLYATSLYAFDVKGLIYQIESQKLTIDFATDNQLGKANLMTLNYQNINTAYLHIYHIDADAHSVIEPENPASDYKLSLVYEQSLLLDTNGKFNHHSKDFLIPAMKNAGEYFYLITPTKDSADIFLKSENIDDVTYASSKVTMHAITVIVNENAAKLDFTVLDSKSGKVVQGAKVYWQEVDQELYTFLGTTNAEGTLLTDRRSGNLKIKFGNDSVEHWNYTREYDQFETLKQYRLLTDRGVYRPGQTVHFKAFAYGGKSPDYKVLRNENIEVSMTDYNGVETVVAMGKTNDFGTFAGSYNLPKNMRTGSMYFRLNNEANANILVEEYKRPSFEIDASNDKESYQLGDKITIKGKIKAYSGYGISNAKVQLKISYTYGYRGYYGDPQTFIDSTIQSDSEGNFTFAYLAKTDQEDGVGAFFQSEISVTSLAGETQRTTQGIFVGRERSAWKVFIPSEILSTDAGKISVAVEKTTVGFKQIEIQVWKRNPLYESYFTFPVSEFQGFTDKAFQKSFPDAVYGKAKNSQEEFLFVKTVNVNSGDSISLHALVNRKAGNYDLRLTYRSEIDTISMTQNFNYIDFKSKKGQHETSLYAVVDEKPYHPGDIAEIIVYTKFKKLNVLLEIYRGEVLLRKEWITVKGRKKIKYTVQNEDLGGIAVKVLAMRDFQIVQTSVNLNVPFEAKNLQVKLETVRDILRPGAKENWTVSVSAPDGTLLPAELVAAMTDASLDQFGNNDWFMSIYDNNYNNTYYQYEQNSTDYFNVQGAWAGSFYLNFSEQNMMYDEMPVMMEMKSSTNANMTYGWEQDKDAENSEPKTAERTATETSKKPVDKVRTNFNETAFFYPQLTAKDNKFQFEFTLPDALTRWKFQALAHDKMMRFGYTIKEVIAQKELMVDPNEPRFFRAGDQFVFAVNLINLTEKSQNVKATLEWFDPFTNIVLPNVLGKMAEQEVVLDAKGMKTINWELKIPTSGLELIAYRVKVSSDQFSDAEEKVIPILSKRVQSIESIPITIDGKGESVYELQKLLNPSSVTQKNEKLIFEYNANPIWSAVMAIPYLSEYPYDCAEQVFSKYFANRISQAIIEKNPVIAAVLAQPNTNNPDKFLSALESNDELKSIILAETPWVLEAKSESEQKRRIAQLFDANNMQQQEQTNLEKLRQMQNSDGGWPWFAGGKSNVYITQHILAGFGHLQTLNLEDEEIDFLGNAKLYLYNEYAQQFKVLKPKQMQNLEGLSALHIQWLYTTETLGAEENEVSDYYSKCLERDWLKYPLHLQAMAGVYFSKKGNQVMQQKIYQSIRSKATTKKNLGTYWNENKNAWSWERNAIETQASLIEFFQISKADEKTLSGMKLWLLNQKRGQYWESTKTTAWACYALLMNEAPVQKSTFSSNIQLGNKTIQGTESGYIRETYTGGEIQSQMGRLTINQTAEAPAFGSLNLIYTDEIENISKNNSGMQIDKQIFLVRNGKEILLTAGAKVTTGDLLRVRLQITSDRALEFVHVKDLKASGTENVETLSRYTSSGNLYYYCTNRDASTEFFLDNFPKGKYTISYDMRASGKGVQSTGFAIVECLYAPEFKANSASGIITVE